MKPVFLDRDFGLRKFGILGDRAYKYSRNKESGCS